ncbi:V-type ATP synthase subunit B [Thiohalobacter thiocyanaticus]|uniref:V-type ATP synthase beta chain n=1 Tax=Thiohalobacter thiocyanaticus TaxID=585455 RepID=A0A426QE48_9GAMM|nr:V-type ATP synthase subunit B [Thiohalobacter thiocyanaticus]RRQ20011.1 V-type ATP synthase subunit B [Thiohalobacter thiocyanaticus]
MKADLYAAGNATRIDGPLLFLERSLDVGLNEAVEVSGADGRPRLGRVSALDDDFMTIEVLETTQGLALNETRVRFRGAPLHFSLGPDLLGRVYDGVGRVIDGGPPIAAEQHLRIEGMALNPARRASPADFIETGISSIDIMDSLVRGQKLPIFSGGGLPHDALAIQLARQSRLRGDDAGRFSIVFAGIGIPHDTAEQFRTAMERSGALGHTALFLNLASDSSVQRLLTPRFALTAAEYLAYELGHHVLVILTDITNYCEALREVSASHGEIPSRKGYPGYMYSDLATLYERAGIIEGRPGSLTQIPILSMPSDDISHPIPDLTGYITEGQIVLDRNLHRRGLYPPVKVLPSLSRLMKDGTGRGFTHEDHPDLANQLYAAYARAVQVRVLANVVGEDGLTETDRYYLRFGDSFEHEFIAQEERRGLEASMEIGWRLLAALPASELHRLSDAQIAKYIEPHHG